MKSFWNKIDPTLVTLFIIFFLCAFFPPEIYLFSKTLTTILVVLLGFQIIASRPSLFCEGYWLLFISLSSFLLINMIFSMSPYRSAIIISYYLQLCILFLVFQKIVNSQHFSILLKYFVALATLLSLYGIYQYFFGFEHLASLLKNDEWNNSEEIWHKIHSRRIFSTFVLPSSLAGYLLLMIPMTLYMTIISKKRRVKILYVFSIFMQAMAFLLSFSLGALMAFLMAIFIMGPLTLRKRKGIMLVSSLLIFLILSSLFLLYRGINPIHLFSDQSPLLLRAGNWKNAWLQLSDHPFFGVGNGSFGINFSQYREAWMNESNYAHNTYLQILAENGLVSLPFLMAFFFVFFNHFIVWTRASPPIEKKKGEKKIFPFLFLACLSWLIHNFIDFTFYHPSVSFPFFSLLGVFFSQQDLWEKEYPPMQRSENKSKKERGKAGTIPRRVLIEWKRLGILILLSLIALFSIQSFIADDNFEKAINLIKESHFAEADEALQKAERMNPWKSEYRIFRAQLLMDERFSKRDLHEALKEAQKAISLDDKIPYYHQVLSDILILSDQPIAAFLSINNASEMYPIEEDYLQRKKILEDILENSSIREKRERDHDSSSF